MAQLASLAEAKGLLRIDFSDDDAALQLLLDAASSAVVDYLQGGGFPVVDDAGQVTGQLPAQVKIGTIMLAGFLYENPDQDPKNAFSGGHFPSQVLSLLRPLRKPTLA